MQSDEECGGAPPNGSANLRTVTSRVSAWLLPMEACNEELPPAAAGSERPSVSASSAWDCKGPEPAWVEGPSTVAGACAWNRISSAVSVSVDGPEWADEEADRDK